MQISHKWISSFWRIYKQGRDNLFQIMTAQRRLKVKRKEEGHYIFAWSGLIKVRAIISLVEWITIGEIRVFLCISVLFFYTAVGKNCRKCLRYDLKKKKYVTKFCNLENSPVEIVWSQNLWKTKTYSFCIKRDLKRQSKNPKKNF